MLTLGVLYPLSRALKVKIILFMLIIRKTFLKDVSVLAGASMIPSNVRANFEMPAKTNIKLGFVTYLWCKDWDD